jgi:hypothetical protein
MHSIMHQGIDDISTSTHICMRMLVSKALMHTCSLALSPLPSLFLALSLSRPLSLSPSLTEDGIKVDTTKAKCTAGES